MKLQCGLFHFDRRLVTEDDVTRLLGDEVHEPREISGTLSIGSLLMLFLGDRIAPEEEKEVQPLRLEPYALTWDGRLDNREELANRLGVHHCRELSDPALVLQAYIAFGDRVLESLVGEFALALWSSRTQSLRFARSTCGARPLYYAVDKNTLTWSSNLAHLVNVTDVDLTVNDSYAVNYLVSQPPACTSPLTNIGVIPPNHVVEFNKGQCVASRELWNPSRFVSVLHHSDKEYEEHFLEVFQEAVKVRLRSNRTVFAELSGGLDSSSVVLMADRVLRQRYRSPAELQTTSCVYEQSESCDERRFIQAVEERRGINTHLVHERDQRATLGLNDPEFTGLPNPLHCFPGRYQAVADQMRTYGAQILLTGRGGDHLLWSQADGTPLIADEISKGHLFRFHSECRTWSLAAGAPYYELLKRSFSLARESRFPSSYSFMAPELPSWLHPRVHKQLSPITPSFDGFCTWRGDPSKRAQIVSLEHMFRYLGSAFLQEYGNLYVSHPYSHRPLIEFCLGTPVSQFLRHGQTRSLMRRALRDLLPEKIAKRVSKGLLDESINRTLEKEWADVSDTSKWKICERDYVSHDRLNDVLKRARLGNLDLVGSVIRIISFERWLRSLSLARRPVRRLAKLAIG